MSDVEGDVPSAAPVEAAGPMGINEAIQEVLKQVSDFLPITPTCPFTESLGSSPPPPPKKNIPNKSDKELFAKSKHFRL